jgi:hypothetical protein
MELVIANQISIFCGRLNTTVIQLPTVYTYWRETAHLYLNANDVRILKFKFLSLEYGIDN